jgi:GT2 family glycosyltransferase
MGADGVKAMIDCQPSLIHFPPLTTHEPITVAIPNYNGKHDIADAILSARNSTYPPKEILVIDDGSTDGSVSFIRKNFPDVRIIEFKQNSGGILNRVRNRALHEARTRLVFLMDHDIVLDPTCLAVLVSQMQTLPQAAALTTRAVYHHDPNRIYVDAQSLHFLCNAVALTRDGAVSQAYDKPKPSVGWGTQLIDKEKAALIGFFDEDYVIGWGDDGQFHHKLRLCGLDCYSVPNALVYHKRVAGDNRIYALVHNRWALIIETYGFKTIILLTPAMLLYEIANFSFLLVKGQSKEYLRAVRDIIYKFPQLISKRSKFQKLRLRSDRDLLVSGPIYIRKNFLNKRLFVYGMGLLNQIFDGYWKLVSRFI